MSDNHGSFPRSSRPVRRCLYATNPHTVELDREIDHGAGIFRFPAATPFEVTPGMTFRPTRGNDMSGAPLPPVTVPDIARATLCGRRGVVDHTGRNTLWHMQPAT